MNNNIKKIIANKVVLSFFISSIIILIIYVTIYNKIVYYANIINTTSISINTRNKDIKYDINTKRIISYPAYGDKYANLLIDSINLNLPIYHGDNMSILSIGVGHYAGSYFPGEGGTVVLAAHNTEGFFKRFEELKINDIVKIKSNYGEFTYNITDIKILNEKEMNASIIEDDKELLIMYTCYPINENIIGRRTKRYVVYAELIGDNYE